MPGFPAGPVLSSPVNRALDSAPVPGAPAYDPDIMPPGPYLPPAGAYRPDGDGTARLRPGRGAVPYVDPSGAGVMLLGTVP